VCLSREQHIYLVVCMMRFASSSTCFAGKAVITAVKAIIRRQPHVIYLDDQKEAKALFIYSPGWLVYATNGYVTAVKASKDPRCSKN
jgi:hypothetical protein